MQCGVGYRSVVVYGVLFGLICVQRYRLLVFVRQSLVSLLSPVAYDDVFSLFPHQHKIKPLKIYNPQLMFFIQYSSYYICV